MEWLELAIRWIHVIAGVAWIGTSFYFNWLNDRLAAPAVPEEGVVGELWSVHGGGFYRSTKYAVAPSRMPGELHWFKWDAYLTWISGASLLILVYYLGADVYLVDPNVAPITPAVAITIAVGSLVLGWLLYDALCRTPLAKRPVLFGLLGFALVLAVAYGLARTLGSRAAYLHVGAMIGTIMAANVFFVIIPAQKELVRAVQEGREPNAAAGTHAANRSLHNNYFALPVLFVMISHHYPITYGHRYQWLILGGLFLIGALTRYAFNLRNQGRPRSWILPAAALGLIALAYVSGTSRGASGVAAGSANGEPVDFQTAREILIARCVTCHSAQPAHRLFDAAPGGIAFDTPEQIGSWADRIYAVAVQARIMPLGNFTGMTDEERARLGRWIEAGAKIE